MMRVPSTVPAVTVAVATPLVVVACEVIEEPVAKVAAVAFVNWKYTTVSSAMLEPLAPSTVAVTVVAISPPVMFAGLAESDIDAGSSDPTVVEANSLTPFPSPHPWRRSTGNRRHRPTETPILPVFIRSLPRKYIPCFNYPDPRPR